MMNPEEWAEVRKSIVEAKGAAETQIAQEYGHNPAPISKAMLMAAQNQALSLSLIALVLCELIEPPPMMLDPSAGQPAPEKKGDDRGPAYRAD